MAREWTVKPLTERQKAAAQRARERSKAGQQEKAQENKEKKLPAQSTSRASTTLLDAGSVYNAQRPGVTFRAQRQQTDERLTSRLVDAQKAAFTSRHNLDRVRTGALSDRLGQAGQLRTATDRVTRQTQEDTTPRTYDSVIDRYDAMREPLEEQLAQAQNEADFWGSPGQAGPKYQEAMSRVNQLQSRIDSLDDRTQKAQNSLQARQRDIQNLQAEQQYNLYGSLRSAPDFAELSQYQSTDSGRDNYNALSGMYDMSRYGDPLYEYVNRNEDVRRQMLANDVDSAFMGFDDRQIGRMTDDEVSNYNYLYATEGADSANEYLSFIMSDLYQRQRQAEQEQMQAWAKENPVASSVYSAITSPMRGLSYLGQGLSMLTGNGLDANAGYNRFVNQGTDIREAVSEDMGSVGSFLYNTGMSIADFLVATGITGGSGALTTAILGSGAAADTVVRAKERGLSDGKALTLGTLAGVAEAVTEKFSVEALLDRTSLGKSALGYFLKNTLTEGSEEVASDLVNTFADVLIAKDKSEWSQSIQAYMAQGMSEQEAFEAALVDQAQQMGLDFLGGAISGAAISGPVAITSAVARKAVGEGRNGRVSNNTAEEVLNDEQAMNELGVQVDEDATISEKRDAVREAVERVTQEEQTGQTGQGVPSEQSEAAVTGTRPSAQSQQKTGQQARTSDVRQQTTQQQAAQQRPETAAERVNNNRILREAKGFGESGQKALQASYDGGNVASYYGAFAAYYQAGLTGRNQNSVNANYRSALNDAQKYAAYTAGQNDAQASLARETTTATNRHYAPGISQRSRRLLPRNDAKLLDALGKAAGVNIEVVETMRDNGHYTRATNTIMLARDADNPLQVVVAHELTHRLQDTAPEEYRQYRDYVMSVLPGDTSTLIENKIREYRSANNSSGAGQNLSYEEAMDEIVADFTRDMVDNAQLFSEVVRQNQNIAQRFITWIKNLISKLRKQDFRASVYGVSMDKIKQAADLWQKAYNDTVSSMRTAKSGNNESTSPRSSVRESQNSRQYDDTMSYRGYTSGSPMPSVGYAMFTDDPGRAYYDSHGGSASGRQMYSVDKSVLTDVSELSPRVSAALQEAIDNRELPPELEYLYNIDGAADSISSEMNPADIVDGAGFWDNADLVSWVFENTDIFDGIVGVKTEDGAVVFDEAAIRRVDGDADVIGQKESGNETQVVEEAGIDVDEATESAYPARFSLRTWNDSDYVTKRAEAAEALSKAIGVSRSQALSYIDDVNSIAKVIADDRQRLDFDASGDSPFVSNSEYGGSIDFSTICKKRRVFTGTFEAIQNALPDTALTADEMLKIRNMLADKGYEVSCGLCYVEGSRMKMGTYAKAFVDAYAATNPPYVPTVAEINTPTGIYEMRQTHPEVYEAYNRFMNLGGRLSKDIKHGAFSSQAKPKMYQLDSEYQGEIVRDFRGKPSYVERKNMNGGLRIQSFSDFESVHLLDMMQVIMDMSEVGLAGQAYTKVPNMAWAFGDTGLKINLSLISGGVVDGRITFDPVEGMPEADAMALRDRYSKNVGTILVVFTQDELKAALNDDRVDFIIPFHRSQWSKAQYGAMGIPTNAKDFTREQNESYIVPVKDKNGKNKRPSNFMPNEYWDFTKTGKENAEVYLQMCADDNRKPKFSSLLVDNGDGSYSLQPDGSTDGYWKTLIDFKMYDNDGNGSPQLPVSPVFNMEEANRILREYEGGHQKFPVAQDVVDEFLESRASMRDRGSYVGRITDMQQRWRNAGLSEAEIQQRTEEAVPRILEEMANQYGTIPTGENPTRSVGVPRKTDADGIVSRTVRTVLEAGATPDNMVPKIEELIADGAFSYDIYTDEAAMRNASSEIETKGFDSALDDWRADARRGIVSKDQTALGWALYSQAAEKGNVSQAINILHDIVESQHNAAQSLQATRILKRQSPEAQLYFISRSVDALTRKLRDKFGDRAPRLVIDEDLAKKFIEARTDAERENLMREIYRDIGRQTPSTFIEKWNAWRYLAMLGNPRTHVRNIVGNALFYPIVVARDTLAGAAESVTSRFRNIDRTRAPVSRLSDSDRELLSAAGADYDNVTNQMMGVGKYTDAAYANQYIEEGRRIFQSRLFSFVEKLRKANSRAMEVEDVWFAKGHYRRALAMYAKANGITAQQIRDGDIPDAARSFAVNEALKATYRDLNAISYLVSHRFPTGGRFGGTAKFANTIVDAILPFRRTPANILARGLEYSPLNLLRIIYRASQNVHNGNYTAAQAIEDITTTLTGSALFALGAFLSYAGLVRGAGADDEREQKFRELIGQQDYSIEIGGMSITLDWMAPQALPFFMGVNWFSETSKGKEGILNMDALISSLASITEPLLTMSMLSGVQEMFENVSYSEGTQIPTVLADAALSYLSQGVPTLFGQIERSFEPFRMSTYTDKNKFLNADLQYELGSSSSKIPGVDYGQIPYIDAWGRKETSGNIAERLFNNMINPAYTSTVQTSEMEEELLRLYEATGNSAVFPTRMTRFFTVPDPENPEKSIQKQLTADEYVQYATEAGQASREAMESLVKNPAYEGLSDEDKAEVISDIYSYCRTEAQKNVDKTVELSSTEQKALDAKTKYGIGYDTFALVYRQLSPIRSFKDENGNNISNSSSLQKMDIIYKTKGLTSRQKQYLISCFVDSKTVSGYNPSKVTEELNKARRESR